MAKRRYRRRARRLRRFRRTRRSSFRRRFSRSRRSFRRWRRRGRYYYRRKNFYQRRGYKLAVTRFKATGIFTRTYKFYCNPFLLQNNSDSIVTFTWDGNNLPPDYIDSYLPSNFVDYDWHSIELLTASTASAQSKAFSGPCNMYGVRNLPISIRRALGYSAYTVINLSQLGVFWLLWNFNYINQRDLIKSDCEKYGYYRALSVTVKFVPRFASPPGKVSGVVPSGFQNATSEGASLTKIPMNELQLHRISTEAGTWAGGSTVASGGTWATNTSGTMRNGDDIPIEVNLRSTGVVQASYWDDDALTLVGYLIPSGPDLDDGKTQANFPGWVSSTFGRTVNQPDVQWFTAFRKAGYPRSYISKNKPTSFKFILPQGAVGAQLKTPDVLTNPINLYGYWKTTGDNARSPFEGHKECIKPGLMTAELQELEPRIFSTENTVRHMNYWKYWNPANCHLFIPGATPAMLLNRYKVSFSYKVQYYSRVYDMN